MLFYLYFFFLMIRGPTKSKKGVLAATLKINIHSNPDNGQDINIIEKRLFSFNMEEYKNYLNNKKETIWQE